MEGVGSREQGAGWVEGAESPEFDEPLAPQLLRGYCATPSLRRWRDFSIAYVDQGRGLPLLCLHGLNHDLNDWKEVLRNFSGSHRVIAVDLPGFGLSSKPEVQYDIPLYSSMVEDLLAALHIPQAVLVGSSMGGHIGLFHALRRPDQVKALVLVDTGGTFKLTDEEKQLATAFYSVDNWGRRTPDEVAMHSMRIFYDVDHPECRRVAERKRLIAASDRFRAFAYPLSSAVQNVFRRLLTDEVRTISHPTLIVWGEHDVVVSPELGRELAAKMPRAELYIVPQCGHLPMLERPDAFNARLSAFLETLSS